MRVHGLFSIDAERIAAIKTPRLIAQGVGKIAIDAPVALLVRVGQIAARDVAANPEGSD